MGEAYKWGQEAMRGRREPPSRGQTTLDFVVGVSVFILVVVSVIGFAPSLFEPYEQGGETNTVTADRLASQLVQDTLATGQSGAAVDGACTRAFFDPSYTGSSCPFSGGTVEARLGSTGETTQVNVTLLGRLDGSTAAPELLCVDEDENGELIEASDAECVTAGADYRLAIGDAPPGSDSVVSARRIALLDGRDIVVLVRVW